MLGGGFKAGLWAAAGSLELPTPAAFVGTTDRPRSPPLPSPHIHHTQRLISANLGPPSSVPIPYYYSPCQKLLTVIIITDFRLQDKGLAYFVVCSPNQCYVMDSSVE